MLDRYLLQVVSSKNKRKNTLFNANDLIAITDDGRGIAKHLVELLNLQGYPKAHVVEKIPAASDAVILLDGLALLTSIDDAIVCNKKVFQHAQVIAERFTEKGGVFVTVQATGGTFGLAKNDKNAMNPWSSGIAGLTKTAAQEWPKAVCQAIDIAVESFDAAQIAQKILQQLTHGTSDLECGIGIKGEPTSIELQVVEANQTGSFPVDKNSVMVASGGARGITAACLLALAKQTPFRIVLLGRATLSEEPNDIKNLSTENEIKQALIARAQETQQTVQPLAISQQAKSIIAQREVSSTMASLQSSGCEVLYFPVDIMKLEELQDTLASVRKKWGKITGILHGAGVLADKLISQKTEVQFDSVFNTKVIGLKNLLMATEQDKLNVILLFSSVSARFGNPAQSDYAMANEILNKIAQQEQHKRGKKCLVKSYNWGPWESGMVTPQLKALFEKRGVSILPMDTGIQLFLDELKDSSRLNVEVVLGGKLDAKPFIQTFRVDAQTYPFLTSHIVEDVPVVPACLVLEWFARTAQAYCPSWKFYACRQFKVLSGIRLKNFDKSYDEFQVSCELVNRSDREIQLSLKLLSNSPAPHYSAAIILRHQSVETVKTFETMSFTQSWPWSSSEIYKTKGVSQKHQLFHGEALQAIAELDGFSSAGGSGALYTSQQKKIASGEWKTDLLALDGVLQLLRLWSSAQLNYPTLPTKINEFILCDDAVATQNAQLSCYFKSDANSKYRTVSDAVLQDANGTVYARLNGVEMCAIQIN